jgi:hypothetical protein
MCQARSQNAARTTKRTLRFGFLLCGAPSERPPDLSRRFSSNFIAATFELSYCLISKRRQFLAKLLSLSIWIMEHD